MTTSTPTSLNFNNTELGSYALNYKFGSFTFYTNYGTSGESETAVVQYAEDTQNPYLQLSFSPNGTFYNGSGFTLEADGYVPLNIASLRLVNVSQDFTIAGYGSSGGGSYKTIDASVSASYGNISYTVDTVHGGGILTFSNEWSSYSSLTFYGKDGASVFSIGIDDIVLKNVALALADGSDSGIKGDAITSDAAPTLEGTAAPGVELTVTLDDEVLGSTVTVNADGTFKLADFAADLQDGVHTVLVEDKVNGFSNEYSFTVDTKADAPELALNQFYVLPGTGENNTTDVTPLISGSGEAGAIVTVFVDGNNVGTTQVNQDKTWWFTTSQLDAGKHEVTAVQEDVAGNESALSDKLTITVSLPGAPVLASASDTGKKGDRITSDTTPTLSGVARPDTKIFIMDGNYVVAETTTNEDGTWTVDADLVNPYLYEGPDFGRTAGALQDGGYKVEGKHELRVAFEEPLAINYARGAWPTTLVKGAALTLTIDTKPVVAPTAPPTTVDGVDVITAPVTTPGGGTGTSIVVPVVTPGRAEDSGDAATADIPLQSQSGQSLLTAKVHTGYGLTANGGIVQGNASSLAELIAAIKATGETNQISDVTHLTDGGTSFLSLLPNDSSLLVQTIRLSGGDVNGSGALDLVGNTDTRAAIVLDGTQLAAGTHITLSDIPFAAVFGDVHVTATTANQILTGDAAGQTFVVSTGASSTVLSGAGADTLQFGVGSSTGASAADGQATASTTLLHGGTEADVAVFNGKAADFTVVQHDGYVLVSANSAPEQVAKVVNVESLQFSDQTVAVASRAELTTLAGLYETVLGRQADVGGFDFWGSVEKAGNSLGTIAVAMLATEEGVAHFGALSGDAGHDVAVLYQALFSRAADAAGQAYWVAQMGNGATLAQVADQMAHSAEIVGHQVAVTGWDFSV